MGVASMVIGIVAVIFGFIPFCGAWAVAPAIVGLVLGIVDLVLKTKRGQPRGTAIAGVILNPLAIIIIISWFFFFDYASQQVWNDANWQMQQQLQQGLSPDAGPGFQPQQPVQPGMPGQPDPTLQPLQPMQPMQPVDTAQPAQPLQPLAPSDPQPVPVRPGAATLP